MYSFLPVNEYLSLLVFTGLNGFIGMHDFFLDNWYMNSKKQKQSIEKGSKSIK
jgi:hypothetical protein